MEKTSSELRAMPVGIDKISKLNKKTISRFSNGKNELFWYLEFLIAQRSHKKDSWKPVHQKPPCIDNTNYLRYLLREGDKFKEQTRDKHSFF